MITRGNYSMIDIVAWIATIIVLVLYFAGGRKFDWANALLFIPITLPALTRGAYSNALISVAFGLIAIIRIARDK